MKSFRKVLSCVKLILLTVACGSDPLTPPPPPTHPSVKPIAGFVIFVFLQKIKNTSVAAQARAIDCIFEILIVGAKPRHSGQAAGEKQWEPM